MLVLVNCDWMGMHGSEWVLGFGGGCSGIDIAISKCGAYRIASFTSGRGIVVGASILQIFNDLVNLYKKRMARTIPAILYSFHGDM